MRALHEGLAEIFEIPVDDIKPELSFDSLDIAWDSLAIISTIALVDDSFNVILNGKSLDSCKTVGDIENLIRKAKEP
jgi:acyl carrier protein